MWGSLINARLYIFVSLILYYFCYISSVINDFWHFNHLFFLFRSFDGVLKELSENEPKRISNDKVQDTTERTQSGELRHGRGRPVVSVCNQPEQNSHAAARHGHEA